MASPRVRINYGIRPGWSRAAFWWELVDGNNQVVAHQPGSRTSEYHARKAWERTLLIIDQMRAESGQEARP